MNPFGILFRLVHLVLRLVGTLIAPVFGRFSWNAPGWLRQCALHPRQSSLVAGLLVLAGAGMWSGWNWYQHRPIPRNLITWQVHPPIMTVYTEDPPVISSMEIEFSRALAPLEKVGKEAGPGVDISPTMKGAWTWQNDSTLSFHPKDEWVAGQRYDVHFDPAHLFVPKAKLAGNSAHFQAPSFDISFERAYFNESPEHPSDKQAILEVSFNYPVDPASFEKHLSLELLPQDESQGRPYPFTVSYDVKKLNATVKAQLMSLPATNEHAHFHIAQGVQSARGGNGATATLDKTIDIPGLYSLTVQDSSARLVTNAQYLPEQVLTVDFTHAVHDHDVAKHIHAWQLKQPTDDHDPGISEKDIKQGKALALTLIPAEKEFQTLQTFRFQAAPGDRIFVRIDKGLTSSGGYVMGQPFTTSTLVPDYPKFLHFMSHGALLSFNGSRRIPLVSRNIPGMKLNIGRVEANQLQNLASLNVSSYEKPAFDGRFDEDHLVDRTVITRAFPPQEDPTKPHYEGVDLGNYLKPGQPGVFLLSMSAYDPEQARAKREERRHDQMLDRAGRAPPAKGEATDHIEDVEQPDDGTIESGADDSISDTRLIVLTDLGLIVKTQADGSQDLFVQSIRTGQPVVGVEISALSVNGNTIDTHSTDAEGIVHFPDFSGLRADKVLALYIARKGDDLSFLPASGTMDRQLNYSRFDVGGELNPAHPGELSAALFSDRGLYRPGDTMHIGLIVRAADWARDVANIPLVAEVTDPRGSVVKTIPVRMDHTGFAELDYTPAETAPTGQWTVNLSILRGRETGSSIGHTDVMVKEFEPDRIKVAAHLSTAPAQGWVRPDQVQGMVDAHNLFGTPASNRQVEGSIQLRPAWPSFRNWPDYHFYEAHQATETHSDPLPDGKTDENGHAVFDLGLKRYENATWQLNFLAKVHEAESGHSVAALATTLVSGADYLVGYKSTDNLSYIARDAAQKIRLVAIGPDTKAVAATGLTLHLLEQRYVSVLTQDYAGTYKYESKRKEIELSAHPLDVPAEGLDLPLRTDHPGDYILAIRRNDETTDLNRIAYSVAGNADQSRSMEHNAELQLTLDKTAYNPGDTINIAMTAPYTGSGLITIERDKVYAHAWFHTDTTSSVQQIVLPPDFEGTGYINVQFIRDPASDQIFTSPLSYGVVPFATTLNSYRNDITLNAPDVIKPDATATFTLHTAHPAKVVIFGVDEGILQVAGYKLPDPLKNFFPKKMLNVSTSQILDLILPEFEKLMAAATAPGGDTDANLANNLNPFRRKHSKPVAFWSGLQHTNGDQTFTYKIPSAFSGQIHVMAVAVSPNMIGTAETSTTVRPDFVLNPNVPTTLAPGDETDVSLGVANNLALPSNAEVPISLTLTTGPELDIVGASSQNLPLAPMKEGSVSFHLRATDHLGSGKLVFTARSAHGSATQSVDISIRPATPYQTTLTVTPIAAHDQKTISPLRALYPQYAVRMAELSNSTIVLASGLKDYLYGYVYACSEQLVSMAMPRLILEHQPKGLKALLATKQGQNPTSTSQDTSPESHDPGIRTLAATLDLLRTRQNQEGGFGLWMATPKAVPSVSAYVMHFLIEAQDRGADVPAEMIKSGNQYLSQLSSGHDATTLDSLRNRAYATYLLTRQGEVTTDALADIHKLLQEAYPKTWPQDLAAVWLAASYKLLQQDDEADRLITAPETLLTRAQGDENIESDDPFSSEQLRDVTTLYILARHFPERANKLPPQVMSNLAWPVSHEGYHSLSAAMTLLAMDSYNVSGSDTAEGLSILATAENNTATPIGTRLGDVVFAHGWDQNTKSLHFQNTSSQPAWGVISQRGFDLFSTGPASQNGMELIREYTDAKGHPVSSVHVGDEIDVHLRLRSTSQHYIANVAVTDLLPGGFEPVTVQPDPDHAGTQPDTDTNSTNAEASSLWRSTIAQPSTNWLFDYVDAREDRVVLYGSAEPNSHEFVYKIRATNTGKFIIPSSYAEAMYNRSFHARTAAGNVLTVTATP